MKIWLTTILFCLSALLLQAHNTITIRDLYEQASLTEEKAELLLKLTTNANETNPILLGYKGAANMIMAKYKLLPTTKLSYFNEGKKILEKAIKSAPNNVELHYIRLSIQLNIPSFLGYSSQINSDKKILIQHIKSNPLSAKSDLEKRIINFLLSNKQCTKDELSIDKKHE